jgi:hypothetical protein
MTLSNNPPPFEAFSLHIEELFALVSGTTNGAVVETDEQDAALDALMDDLRKARKDADAERAAEKRPYDDAANAVQAKWKPLLQRCDMGVAEIKKLLTPYRDAKQRAKDEAARKAREEAAERERVAQEALRQSDDLEARFAAEASLKQARKLTAAANKIDRSATGLRTSWAAEITDPLAFGRWLWTNRRDEYLEWLAGQADSLARTRPTVPGVLYHERKNAA